MKKYDVLLATQDRILISSFKRYLVARNIKLSPVNTPKELNKIFRKRGKDLEVLMLDIRLPEDEIKRFIFYVKQFKRDIPVFLLAIDHKRVEDVRKEVYQNFSVYGFFRKPKNKQEVEKIIYDLNHILDLDMDKKFNKIDYIKEERVFACTLKNGKTYFLMRKDIPEDDGTNIKQLEIIEDDYYFSVYLESGKKYVIPWDFVISICEREYRYYRNKITDHITPEEIGEKIKGIRKRKHLTQKELSIKTGILRPNIARIESGKHTTSLETLEKIADALEIPVVELVIKEK